MSLVASELLPVSVSERRPQRSGCIQPVPRLKVDAPNQIWSWYIAKLATQKRGEYLSLYVVMDLYSGYIVTWMLSHKENSALSSQLIAQAHERYSIAPGTLTLHRVSNDNAFSEAQFKTMKYQPDYPRRFDDYQHAMLWCEDYVSWYNNDHLHSALGGFITVQHVEMAKVRQATLDDAFAKHPERFGRGRPTVQMPPLEVCINPVAEDADQETIEKGGNFPTLPRVI